MSELLCVTNRTLCAGGFLERVAAIADQRPAGIILREKDLPEGEYEALARQVLAICRERNVRCILHTFVPAAERLRVLRLPILAIILPPSYSHLERSLLMTTHITSISPNSTTATAQA